MKRNEDHFKVIRKIVSNPDTSQRKLAQELGFSLGKLNYCINELKKKGFTLYTEILFRKLSTISIS